MTAVQQEQDARALRLIRAAYNDDAPVVVGHQTRRRASGVYSVARTCAQRLALAGLVRPSVPAGRFVLLTDAGKREVGLTEHARAG